MRPLD